MDRKIESSSQLITRREALNLDDTLKDVEKEIFENNILPVKSKFGRKLVWSMPRSRLHLITHLLTFSCIKICQHINGGKTKKAWMVSENITGAQALKCDLLYSSVLILIQDPFTKINQSKILNNIRQDNSNYLIE